MTQPSLVLCYAPVACSLVPYLTLTEAGAEFSVQLVNNERKQNTSPEYLAINPKGKVPVLIIDGEVLTENTAIQVWIARQFPAAKLLPEGMDEIRALSLMNWFASAVHQHLTPINRPARYCDVPGTADNVRKLSTDLLRADFAIAEQRLAGREWFFDHFTTVDAYFFWCFRRAILFGLDLSEFANCMAHQARVARRPSAQKVVAFEAEAKKQLAASA